MKKALWVILKIFGYIILLIIAATIAWILYNLNDEKLEPEAAAFFHEDVVNEADNGFIALSGITAPEGMDIFEYGKKVLAANGNNPDKNEIAFKGDASSFECWITQQGKEISKEKGKPCASAEQLTQAINDNQLLLERYVSLRKYERFLDKLTASYYQDIIKLNELYLARLALLVEQGKTKEAMDGWLANAAHLQRIMTDKQTMIGKSIIVLLLGFNEKFLPVILEKQPSLAKDYYAEIHKILDTPAFGEGGWDVAATMRAEYGMIHMFDIFIKNHSSYLFLYKHSNITNSFYHYAKDMVALSQQSPEKFAETKKILENTYPNSWKMSDLLYNPAGNLMLRGMFVGTDLLKAWHYHVAYLKMLRLYMEAKIHNISNADMPEFIKNADKKFQNPLTNLPFLWNSATNSIYFELINDNRQMPINSIFY